jgi:hypothetical protein
MPLSWPSRRLGHDLVSATPRRRPRRRRRTGAVLAVLAVQSFGVLKRIV